MMQLACRCCGYLWTYKGVSPIAATCPRCYNKVRIPKELGGQKMGTGTTIHYHTNYSCHGLDMLKQQHEKAKPRRCDRILVSLLKHEHTLEYDRERLDGDFIIDTVKSSKRAHHPTTT